MPFIKDLMVGDLIDEPLFRRRNERADGPIAAEHQIEQSITAMGDQFQLNYMHSPLLLPLCSAQPSRCESSSHLPKDVEIIIFLASKLKAATHVYF